MSCKSSIYVTNTATTAVPANGTLPLTSIIRRYGPDITFSGNSIILNTPGYYVINATTTFTAPAAGNVTLAIQQNNATVTGATATTSIATATTEVRSLAIPGIEVRVVCGAQPSIISLANTGVAATFSNIALSAVKI